MNTVPPVPPTPLFLESPVGSTNRIGVLKNRGVGGTGGTAHSAKSFGMKMLVFIRDKKIYKRKSINNMIYSKH